MTEYEYRGKHVHVLNANEHLDGRWVYGYLSSENYINSPELEGEFLIDVTTIGQYTQAEDIKKNRIYTGDIIRYQDAVVINGSREHLSEVMFSKELGSYCFKMACIGYGTINPATIESLKIEVVGNKFDNPELLHET